MKKGKIKIKRIYDSSSADDGYRILVDRLWPRGIKKDEAKLDEWNKDIAPSSALRKWFGHKKERFEEFALRYKAELEKKKPALRHIREMAQKKNVTLLYAAKDPEMNQAVVLLDHLMER